MDGKYNWYTAIPERDRIVIDATAKWLRPVPWQWFVTLTFSWNVRGETADLKLKQWLNTVERELKARVCFVASKQCKPPSFAEWRRALGSSTYWCRSSLNTERITRSAPGGIWLSCQTAFQPGALTPDQAYFNPPAERWQPKTRKQNFPLRTTKLSEQTEPLL